MKLRSGRTVAVISRTWNVPVPLRFVGRKRYMVKMVPGFTNFGAVPVIVIGSDVLALCG